MLKLLLNSLISQNLTLTVNNVKERALSIYNNTLHSKLNNTPQKVFLTLKILKIEKKMKKKQNYNVEVGFVVFYDKDAYKKLKKV
jgi:hypothetical protein